jgi:hypothetical protein
VTDAFTGTGVVVTGTTAIFTRFRIDAVTSAATVTTAGMHGRLDAGRLLTGVAVAEAGAYAYIFVSHAQPAPLPPPRDPIWNPPIPKPAAIAPQVPTGFVPPLPKKPFWPGP